MKIISKDLRDGEKLPERHVFNGNAPLYLHRARAGCGQD